MCLSASVAALACVCVCVPALECAKRCTYVCERAHTSTNASPLGACEQSVAVNWFGLKREK